MCGIFGVIGSKNAFIDIYKGLKMIQHRGQDTCGIVTFSSRFNIKLAEGLITNSFDENDINRLDGHAGIGHVRYPTIGKGGIENAQPVYTNTPYGITMAHNGNVVNYFSLKRRLIEDYHRYINSEVDVQIILNVFAHHLSLEKNFTFESLCGCVEKVFDEVKGSYSVVSYIAGQGFLAFRDPVGYRPLVFGTDGERYAFSSESVSLESIGIENFEDVKPGEVIFITDKGKINRKIVRKSDHKACIFEWIYFARPDSIIDGIDVYNARYRLGEKLAEVLKDRRKEFDVVIPVPDTSRTAALALSTKLELPYREGLIKNRYIGRTFIMPGQKKRIDAVREKLHPIKIELKDKRVLLIDDSIVRGNTSKSIVKLVREAGAKEVHFAVYSSPLKFPCYFGIDIQKTDEFIANKTDFEKIATEIGADSLTYLPLEKMIEGVGVRRNDFCTSCFSGKYDIPLDQKDIDDIKKDRTNSF
ncbi:MAG: amidophosphoribosyltransferase [bacterium]|uniref:Amidophosphoribosyltransferase n=2 Tax=Bacteria candidate phyla TaxID=1783234 RepID=A0A101I1A0_UNCT6|nr:MAG: amidophosphoribosyltransferase [candidate division TA06 bacterium 32_111]KUK86629.1 MAG: amidophosphoribosyltransferase [candidate division TA06 bacterium 34_109]MDI6699879.1 amidophosphoribosyltransferase [bacterium]HAF07733.1 amidophosphoribosyltransferase [candidate division WOR-3 bacterium]HCP17196.1 amidophosphoribosyltransferase [candidate division WOR-3 bacterium]